MAVANLEPESKGLVLDRGFAAGQLCSANGQYPPPFALVEQDKVYSGRVLALA